MSFDFTGDGTFYGGAGNGGACSSSYVPEGFTTVAMNNPQYNDGLSCGSCLEGILHLETGDRNFKAIVDNLCNECLLGSLDFGENNDGRWKVEWSFIQCPNVPLIITTQGSNSNYGKIKIEGSGPIISVNVNDIPTSLTNDGYWVVNDSSGNLGCGPKLIIIFQDNTKTEICISGTLFGNICSTGLSCIENNNTPVQILNTPTQIPNTPTQTLNTLTQTLNTPTQTLNTPTQIPNTPTQICSEEWEQCNGKNYTGPKCCKSIYNCIFLNDWYSQCQFIDIGNCQKRWEQCGGYTWKGETCCNNGLFCVFINEWYSHCL
jgi:hypothetical protein